MVVGSFGLNLQQQLSPFYSPTAIPSFSPISRFRNNASLVIVTMSATKNEKVTAASDPVEPAEVDLDKYSQLLETFYRVPAIDKGWLFSSKTGDNLQAMVAMNQGNLVANSMRKYISSIHIPRGVEDGTACSWSAFPFELTGVSLVVPSNSGKRLLLIKNPESTVKDSSSPTKLEVWSSAQLVKEILVPSSVHGPVYVDSWCKGVSWSQDESYVAYVAEEAVSSRPVFGKFFKANEVAGEKDPYTWKGQGDWQEDWGESYTKKGRPILVVADLQSGCIQKVEGIPDNLSTGQVVWAPPPTDGKPQLLVFVGWTSANGSFHTERKLGLIYCFNRPCALYAIEAPQALRHSDSSPFFQQLTSSIRSAFMPRFSPGGDFVIFLSAQEAVKSGSHNSTNSLHTLRWPPCEDSNLNLAINEVVSVRQPPGGFPGLYCHDLLAMPWFSDGKTLLVSSTWCSTETMLAIDSTSGVISRVTPSDDSSSWKLLCLQDDRILAVSSSFGRPHSLKLGVCNLSSGLNGVNRTWKWLDIDNPFLQLPEKVDRVLSGITYDIMNVPVPTQKQFTEGAVQTIQAIFVASRISTMPDETNAKNPVIVVIHGGPHSVLTTSFSISVSYLAALGINLLLVNYRGSTGFGEDALQSLPGNAGFQDVADVLAALDYAITKEVVDPNKVAVLGGSHGGFLSTHLIGQAPDRFVTAAVRNPVCNISSMVGVTDIPDWCYVETFGEGCFDAYSDAPSVVDLKKFYEASPIAHISKVKVPTLFLLGAQDRRVPISNGLQYVQALRSRGLKSKVIVFPDDAHPIDRPQSDFESWVNIGAWFCKFFQLRVEGAIL